MHASKLHTDDDLLPLEQRKPTRQSCGISRIPLSDRIRISLRLCSHHPCWLSRVPCFVPNPYLRSGYATTGESLRVCFTSRDTVRRIGDNPGLRLVPCVTVCEHHGAQTQVFISLKKIASYTVAHGYVRASKSAHEASCPFPLLIGLFQQWVGWHKADYTG